MDTNFNNQEVKDCEITYYYWCQECLTSHTTPWCPYAGRTDASRKDIGGETVLVYDLCPFCGQEICR